MKLNKSLLGLLLCFYTVTYSDVFYSPEIITQSTFVVNQPGPISFSNNVMYKYDPIDTATGLPMMKIVASDVDIDFNNIGIYNMNQQNNCWVALEIGWTPAELAADVTREQPKNIRIKNLKSYGFCAGLLIHAGVQDVQITNCSFYDMELGIAILGKNGQQCRNIAVTNVNIVGLEDEPDQNLTLLKNMIETDYGYGADYFMPLQPDPLNNNTVDVTTYYGLYAQYVIKGMFKKVDIHNIGYKNYNQISEGNGARTHTYGMLFKNSRRIEIDSVTSQEIDSELYAVGMRLDNINEITITNSNFSYCTSATKAVGIEVTNALNQDYSVNALKMNNVVTKTNLGGTIGIGMDLSSVRGLIMNNVVAKYNMGSVQSYGLYTNGLYTATIENTTLSENSATRIVNDVATTQGINAAGFYGTNVNSLQCRSVDFNSMQALNAAYGLYLSNSSSCQFFDCNFVGNIASTMRSGEAAAIRAAQDAQEISKNAPVVSAASTGAYGVYVQNSKYLRFERCVSNSNTGHRAMGFNFQNCRAVAMYSTFASTQTATGQIFDSSWVTDNVANPRAVPIIAKHQSLLFGDSTKTHVDLVATTDLFLEKIGSIRSSFISGGTPSYSDVTGMLATSSLIQATIARYRLWSVAIGILVQNVAGFLLQDCLCVGQLSMYDNGIGICFAGRNNGHTLKNCNLSFNVGGYVSAQTANTNVSPQYGSSYNLIGLKPFWDVVLQQQQPWTQFQNETLASTITAIAYSPDETKLAIGLSNNTILIYDTVAWSVAQTLTNHTSAITALAWNSDGTKLASSDSGILNNIKIWDTSSWTIIQNLSTAVGVVSSLAWNPNGTGLVSAGAGLLNNIIHWDTSLWSVLHSLTHGVLGVACVAWSADGTKIATASNDVTNNIKIWDTSSWTATQTLTGSSSAIKSLSWRQDGSQLASGDSGGLVKIWETTGWTLVQTLNGSAGAVTNVKFKPDGQWVAAGYANNVLKIFNTSTWALGQTLSISSGAVRAFDWSFKGRHIAYGGDDSTYRVYATDIFNKATSNLVAGLYMPNASTYIAQDSLVYGAAVSDASVFVDVNGTKRNFVSPVGPIGAGLVMGDMMLEGLVEDCQMYSNIGHAGHSYGVLLDKGYSVTLQNNTIAGNGANVHGISTGILDVTAHTPNLYIRNTLEGNKCSIFNNSNYFIPFNSADANNLAFPVNKIKNGSFSNPTTDYDNTVIEYSLNSQFYQYDFVTTIPLHPDLRSYLSSTNCWN